MNGEGKKEEEEEEEEEKKKNEKIPHLCERIGHRSLWGHCFIVQMDIPYLS